MLLNVHFAVDGTLGRDLDRPKLLWVNVVLRMVQSETTYMLYPSNSGHTRTYGVRWRNVCFSCSRFFSPALFCGASPLALGSKSVTNGVDRRQGAGIGPPGGPGSTEPHQRLAGRLEKGTWIRLQVDFSKPFVLHRSPKCHIRACTMETGSGCCRRWLYQPVAVSACDSNIWALAAGPLNPSLYLYFPGSNGQVGMKNAQRSRYKTDKE